MFDTRLATKDTDALSEGNNLYYTTARWDSEMASATTADLTENVSNMYYTTARWDTKMAAADTADLTENASNLYWTTARGEAMFATQQAASSTTDLSEGGNLYFTDERVDDRLNAMLTAGSNITLTYDDVANTMTITGEVEDNFANNTTADLAEDSSNLYYTTARWDTKMSAADTADLTEGTNLYYTTARWDNKMAAADTADLTENASNLYWTTARGEAMFDTRLATKDTADLAENASNLYYTDARADARITNALKDEDDMVSDSSTHVPSQQSVVAYVASQIATKDNTDEMTEGTNNLYYTTARWDTKMSAADTADLTEGTNLYYTTARWDNKMAAADTADLTEGTNLYYTTARWDNKMAAADTADLAENASNLYYTDARADARITNALKDEDDMSSDSNTHVPTQQSVKAYVDAQILTEDNTDEIVEGTNNLYYTTARWDTAFGTATTTGLTEGSNKYYTDARADARTAVSTTANKLVWEAYADQSETDAETTAAATAESKDIARMVTSDAYADASETAAIASAEAKDAVRATAANTYADAAVSTFESSLTHFHSALQTVTTSQETDNATSSTDFTFSELTNARHYSLYINRMLMRASEYSVSGTTVTIITGILALDDELEVTGFSS
jgi:hypothetical protein